MFLTEVLQVLRVCAQWADTTENEEGPLIRELLPSAKNIRPISWYQSEVMQLFHDQPPEDWEKKKMPAAAKTLLDSIKQERRIRSTVRQNVAVEILKELEKAINHRDSEAITRMFDKNGALDPTRDSAPGLDKNIVESSLPPPEITIGTFQNRARTALSRMDTLLVELSATTDPNQLQSRLSAFEVDLSMLLSFIQKLKNSPEVTGVPVADPFVKQSDKHAPKESDDSLFKHPIISSDEESDADDKTPLKMGADVIETEKKPTETESTTTSTTTTTTSSTGMTSTFFDGGKQHEADDEASDSDSGEDYD